MTQAAFRPGTLQLLVAWIYADVHRAGFVGLFKGRYLKPLTVGTSLMLFQQITGQPSVLYYAADIFNKAGIDAGKDATGVSVILGVFKLVMTGLPAADAGQHAIMEYTSQREVLKQGMWRFPGLTGMPSLHREAQPAPRRPQQSSNLERHANLQEWRC